MTARTAYLITIDTVRLLACIWIAILAYRGDWRRVSALLVMGILLTWIALLAGCTKVNPRTTIVQPCHLTTPPPDVAEQDDIQPLVKWSHDAWHACASMRAEDYPPAPVEEGDDDE